VKLLSVVFTETAVPNFVNVSQMSGNYGKCLMKREPSANIIPRSSFTTQFSELSVTYPPVPLDSYGWPEDQHSRFTSQRILPPPELDCLVSTSAKWSPPFPVCPVDQLSTRYKRRLSVEEGYVEADHVPLELQTHAGQKENNYSLDDQRHRRISDDGGTW